MEALAALRHHVTAGSSVLSAPGLVRLELTHSVLSKDSAAPNRVQSIPTSIQIAALKEKLYLLFGTKPAYMRLQLQDEDGSVIAILDNDEFPLGMYGPQDGYRVHVIDEDPFQTVAQMQDVSQVEKYTISEEDYNRRDDTFRKWKANHVPKKAPEAETSEGSLSSDLKIGARCAVVLKEGVPEQHGTVMFIGSSTAGPGVWVGVKFDEPCGTSDGSLQGKKYFECAPRYGAFLKPNKV
eukprot:CAMPEP_0184337608 /NCGR_PEP_ID=MMETSP1089-20130417/6010_1 /TAXON_ID=38269 ORGANISM="Gloeochaete wittrockiana, Strain SAG46.84" /NCGR_SAMPLE_ID=MMETSP1089 /ASSEMBLY_ACC=CAM_ASM_000445 /LENGTH=237 /DNA_ID=CAMNT_0026663463 /DNA_START=30 /DNA_END=740 /DNA_ORIENTATION=-